MSDAGTGFEPVQFARKPNVVLPFAGRVPLYATFRTVTLAPLVVAVPFHAWVIRWPLANDQPTVQPFSHRPLTTRGD